MALRNRAAQACTNCKATKTRCSDSRPCKRCLNSGKAKMCVGIPPSTKWSTDPLHLTASSHTALQASILDSLQLRLHAGDLFFPPPSTWTFPSSMDSKSLMQHHSMEPHVLLAGATLSADHLHTEGKGFGLPSLGGTCCVPSLLLPPMLPPTSHAHAANSPSSAHHVAATAFNDGFEGTTPSPRPLLPSLSFLVGDRGSSAAPGGLGGGAAGTPFAFHSGVSGWAVAGRR
jgi:hypothetical protein